MDQPGKHIPNKVKHCLLIGGVILFAPLLLSAQSKLLIPMDLKQTDHLKSYGVAFWILQHNGEVDWLLNYRGGSFMCDYSEVVAKE